MGIISGIALAIAAVSAKIGYDARQDAKEANRAAAAEQKKARGEVNAVNASKQAQEKRAAIREERVRRGKILQASANTGTSASSGVLGAEGGLSTQLSNNLAINAGMAAAGQRIGVYEQNAADFNLAAQEAALQAQNADSIFSTSMSMFSQTGGFGGK